MGRKPTSARPILERTPCLSIADILDSLAPTAQRAGSPARSKRPWAGKPFASVSRHGQEITVTIHSLGRISEAAILCEPVHLGGLRYFFQCPACQRRARTLYQGPQSYACRQCLGLVYFFSRTHRSRPRAWEGATEAEKKAEHATTRGQYAKAAQWEERAGAYRDQYLAWAGAKVNALHASVKDLLDIFPDNLILSGKTRQGGQT